MQLPDPKDLRRLTTPTDTPIGQSLSALYNSDGWKSSVHAGEYFMQKWKVANIARPALASRMLAMGTAKIAANGLETPMSDPVNLFRMVLNPELRPALAEGAVEGDTLATAEAYQRGMTSVSGHLSSDDLAAHQVILKPGDDGFGQAWSARIAEQHADPVARSIAGQDSKAPPTTSGTVPSPANGNASPSTTRSWPRAKGPTPTSTTPSAPTSVRSPLTTRISWRRSLPGRSRPLPRSVKRPAKGFRCWPTVRIR